MNKPILYGSELSPAVRGVLLTAKAMDLELELRPINILAGEHLTPEYLEMNPQHTIPTLDDNGDVFWDSQAICLYLIDKYAPNDDLYSRDLYTRARINQRLYFVSSVLSPKMSMINGSILFRQSAEIPQAGIDGINEGYEFMEKFLKNDSYLVGDSVTVADFCCVATVSTIQYAVPIDPDTYPKVAEWFENMKSIPFYEEINGKNVEILEQVVLGELEKNRAAAE
ncbi:glutathione S-transferase 1-1-like [Bradysia coprophila]|uniref:glutathione S-transferase 1-1-like n=1 Tax=Bradysia coprophila TaxID=38358 RepID=UPI00187D7A4F|nr:glutathione S-transferase 1-1-like [Bradysia coprophila]